MAALSGPGNKEAPGSSGERFSYGRLTYAADSNAVVQSDIQLCLAYRSSHSAFRQLRPHRRTKFSVGSKYVYKLRLFLGCVAGTAGLNLLDRLPTARELLHIDSPVAVQTKGLVSSVFQEARNSWDRGFQVIAAE